MTFFNMNSTTARWTPWVAVGMFLIPLWCAGQAAWPAKPIHFIVPFSAGGANDLMGRAAAEGASKVLGQTIIVENRPGAGGSLGASIVANHAHHEDVNIALRDAFLAARRQVEEHARKLRGEVKSHSLPPSLALAE